MRWIGFLAILAIGTQQASAQCSHHSLDWPQVSSLYLAVETLDGYVGAGQLDGATQTVPDVTRAIQNLLQSPMPSAVTDPLSLQLELDDLQEAREELMGEAVTLETLRKVLPVLTAGSMALVDEAGVFVKRPRGPHDGLLFAWNERGGDHGGFAELTLREDEGALALWIAQDAAMEQPVDGVLGVQVRFIDREGQRVSLSAPHLDSGIPQLSNGAVRSFVFPADSGEDVAWLKGAGFSALVKVEFTVEGQECESDAFTLVPKGSHHHHH